MGTSYRFDVIIIGSGPAGCAAGLTLKASGYKVAILDNGEKLMFPIGETLQPNATDLLRKLKFDECLLNEFHLPACETVSLWNSPLPVVKESLLNPYGNGWYLDKKRFNEQLIDKCISEGVVHVHGRHLDLKHQPKGGWKISCGDAQELNVFSCAFLIDCTGRNRVLLKKLSIPIIKYDTLIAINAIFSVKPSESPSAAFIESAEYGWWYSSAIPGGKRIVSFFTDAKSAPFKQATKYPNFCAGMSGTHLISACMRYFDVSEPVPLRIRYANSEVTLSFFGPDWICAGDAAAAFDPLSSQGVGTALRMGIDAAEAICDFMGNNTGLKLEQFARNYLHIFHDYRRQRKLYYAQVQKWPHSPFWLTNTDHSIITSKAKIQ